MSSWLYIQKKCKPWHALVHDGQRMNKTTTENKLLWWEIPFGKQKADFFLNKLCLPYGVILAKQVIHTHTGTIMFVPSSFPIYTPA
jgi:hypothetical protein